MDKKQFLEFLKRAVIQYENQPEWKKDILKNSSEPFNKVPRSPIVKFPPEEKNDIQKEVR